MTLPSWFTALVAHWGVNLDDVTALVNELLARTDLTDSAAAADIAAFLGKVVSAVDPANLLLIATAAWNEIKSGHPGYNKDHGGLA